MEETKWLTRGKIILFVIILLVIGGVIAFILIYRNNLKKDYINFENQLKYAAPNYLLKEKISLNENEWREINIEDILKQKLVINKRSGDCEGYVIAEGLENEDEEELEEESTETQTNINTENETGNENSESNDNQSETQTDSNIDSNSKDPEEETSKISNNIRYSAYISCKNIYRTKGYGTRPTDGTENDEETQTENDTEKPKIELFGDNEITLTVGDEYKELGAIAMDNVDGDITSKIKITGKVDTDTAGTYTIKYTVTDSSKNSASIERKVIVEEKEVEIEPETPTTPEIPVNPETPNVPETPSTPKPDTTSPIIIFNDNSLYQTICAGNSVNIATNGPYGYVARDNVDGNITGRVSITGDTGIINSPGIYNLYYSVSDSSGNTAYATKQFTVNSCSSTIPNTEKIINVSSIRCTSMVLSVNEQKSLMVSIYPENATNKQATYISSNTAVATISNNGMVKGVSSGTSRITVTSSNGKKGTCTITVR